MGETKIFLIEDCCKHATEAIKTLEEVAKQYTDMGKFRFTWLKGTVSDSRESGRYYFYDEKRIIEQIEIEISNAKENGDQIGVLLDTLLTKEDIDNALESYYPQATVAREIYFNYYQKIPIYIITSTGAFAGQSSIIMGKDLSEQYIEYKILVHKENASKADIDKLFAFYNEFYKEKYEM